MDGSAIAVFVAIFVVILLAVNANRGHRRNRRVGDTPSHDAGDEQGGHDSGGGGGGD